MRRRIVKASGATTSSRNDMPITRPGAGPWDNTKWQENQDVDLFGRSRTRDTATRGVSV